MGEFEALTFDELFEKTKALPWEEWIPADGKFPIYKAKSVKSKLFSLSDCQSIVKKAVVEKLRRKHRIQWFQETGAEYPIQVSILKDRATLMIDTSGVGLHKRGYREHGNEAPIKETLAAALVLLSGWKPGGNWWTPMRIGDHIDRSSDDWEKHPTGPSEEFCFRGLGSNTRRGVEEGKDGGKACHRCRKGFSYLGLGCGWEVPPTGKDQYRDGWCGRLRILPKTACSTT